MLVLYAKASKNQILARHTSSCLASMIPRLFPTRCEVRSNAIFTRRNHSACCIDGSPRRRDPPTGWRHGMASSGLRVATKQRALPLDAAGGELISLLASPPTPPPSARRGAALAAEPRRLAKSQAASQAKFRGEAPATSRRRERQSRHPLRRPFARSAAKRGKTPEPRG